MLRLQSLCGRPSVRIAVSEIRPVIGLLPSLLSSVGRGLSSSSSSSRDPEGDKLRAAVLQQRRINAENKAAQEAAALLKEHAHKQQTVLRRHTYFGTAANDLSSLYEGPIALEASRREDKRAVDRKWVSAQARAAAVKASIAHRLANEEAERQANKAAKDAKRIAEELQNEALEKPLKAAIEQRLQLHLRQSPPGSAQAFVPGVDERRFRESLSDEQVTVIVLLPSELQAVDGPRFSDWKQHRIAIRDPLTNIKESAAPPTTGPRLTNKPGLYELAVKTKEGRLIVLYLGYTSGGIRHRLSSAGFVPIEIFVRDQSQLERMIYVRELVIEPPKPVAEELSANDKEAIAIARAEKQRLNQTFRAQLLERKERLLDQINYFVNPFGQDKQAGLRSLDHGLTEDALLKMHAAFIEFAQWSVEDRSTSKGRATLLGESGEPEPVDVDSPDDAETKQ